MRFGVTESRASLSGDEEYRPEESLPQLARILSTYPPLTVMMSCNRYAVAALSLHCWEMNNRAPRNVQRRRCGSRPLNGGIVLASVLLSGSQI